MMSDTKTPQGILAVVKMLEYDIEDLFKKDKVPMLVVLENIQDPGNLGTIIRTAEGAGATGIIMSDKTVDIYNPQNNTFNNGFAFQNAVCVFRRCCSSHPWFKTAEYKSIRRTP